MIFNDGSVYDGVFKMNEIDGIGTFAWPDGKIYHGQWKNNAMQGKGMQRRVV